MWGADGGSPYSNYASDYDQFTGGLSEEEQIRRAMEESVHDFRFRGGGGGGSGGGGGGGGFYPNVY